MAVNDVNKEYAANLERWKVVADVTDGARAVKLNAAYLPMTSQCGDAELDRARYLAYRSRAVFYPVAKDTLQNYVGLAFSEDPTFEPDGMDFLKDDADGSGKSIYQLNQTALSYLLKFGRGGFFVDYPQVGSGASVAEVKNNSIRPTVVLYSALDIINWRVKKVGGVFKTSLIVLLEKSMQVDPVDEFAEIEVKSYRVLRLDDNNEYSIQVYSDETGQLIAGEIVYPTNAKGQKWTEIPFIPIGAQTNDFKIDDIPLESLADINLAHYRNSAEYENAVFICGQVQPVMTELDEDWRNFLVENGIKLGSMNPLLLPKGAKFEYISASIEMLAKEAMDAKFDYMQALGAKVLDKTNTVKTATQVDAESLTQHSVLSLCVSNLNEAAEYVLRWCAEYWGSGFDAVFSIKQDFARGEISLEQLKFYQSEVVRGAMSNQTFNEIKTTGKVPEISFDDEQLRIENERNGMTV